MGGGPVLVSIILVWCVDRFLRHEAGPRCPCRRIRNQRWHRLLEGEEFVGKLLGRAGLRRLQRGKGGAGECGLLAGPPSYPVVSGSPSPPSPPSPSPAPPAPPSPTPSSYYWYWDSAKSVVV